MIAQTGMVRLTLTDHLLCVESPGRTKVIRLSALTGIELQEAARLSKGHLRWEYVGNEQRHEGSTVQWKVDNNKVEFPVGLNADFKRLYQEIVAKLDV